jgi:hypothetical protein
VPRCTHGRQGAVKLAHDRLRIGGRRHPLRSRQPLDLVEQLLAGVSMMPDVDPFGRKDDALDAVEASVESDWRHGLASTAAHICHAAARAAATSGGSALGARGGAHRRSAR